MAINESGNLQLQLGPLSGGGQIPLKQVIEEATAAAVGVKSLDAQVGDVLILPADSSLDFQTPSPGVITVRGFKSVVAGAGISVDDSDPFNPVVSNTGGGGGVASVVAGTGIGVDNTDPANPVVSTPAKVASVVAGTGIGVDNTDPANPVVSTPAKVASVVAGVGIAVNNADPANPIVTATGAVAPIGIADRFKAIALSVVGQNGEVHNDAFEGIAVGPFWLTNGDISVASDIPTAIKGGVSPDDVLFRTIRHMNLRTVKWFIGGYIRFEGGLTVGDVRGIFLDDGGDFQNGVFAGLIQTISGVVFNCALVIGGVVQAFATSTVLQDNNLHAIYIWGDTTQVVFAVDFETPIQVTNDITKVPNLESPLQVFGNRGVASSPQNIGDYTIGHSQ